jgi:hypothetical protein
MRSMMRAISRYSTRTRPNPYSFWGKVGSALLFFTPSGHTPHVPVTPHPSFQVPEAARWQAQPEAAVVGV